MGRVEGGRPRCEGVGDFGLFGGGGGFGERGWGLVPYFGASGVELSGGEGKPFLLSFDSELPIQPSVANYGIHP